MSSSNDERRHESRCRKSSLIVPSILLTLLILVLFVVSLVMEDSPWSTSFLHNFRGGDGNGNDKTIFDNQQKQNYESRDSAVDALYMVPKPLLEYGVYDQDTDFENERGIRPTYWHFNSTMSWGPCFPPLTQISKWQDRRNYTSSVNADNMEDFEYLRPLFEQPEPPPPPSIHNANTAIAQSTNTNQYPESVKSSRQQQLQRGGGCRPGFLIIGAGKCGTSSLYHYLVGHPRVLPASEKQIHYFKYHLTKPLGWYYSFFPTPQSFLEHGGLMTGEASPGYLPYPQVAQDVYRLMKEHHQPDMPKIIMVGRSPLDRMYSSYRYNYVYPTLEHLRGGKQRGVPKNLTDEEYEPYLFSLEDFVRTELMQLKSCLTWVDQDDVIHEGFGAKMTLDRWHKEPEFRTALSERNENTTESMGNVAPLIDLDGFCYGKKISKTVLRSQWGELQTQNPEKVIVDRNLHLTQAMIGRSLYLFPLEWWYLVFDASDILFVCTEEMSDPETMRDLALNLGLPSFDFSEVVGEGAYNVGGHRGYDKATSWEELQTEKGTPGTNDAADSLTKAPTSDTNFTDGIPISPELYEELQSFVNPFNERLFQLTGKRCMW